jgi:hypothetical protein
MKTTGDVSLLRGQFYLTAGLNGLKIIPDDTCCRLLAWLYVYGGGQEQVIDGKLSGHILYAQGRLNILGGGKPGELAGVMKEYIASVTDYHEPPAWVLELEHEYGIKPHRGKKDGDRRGR